VKLFVLIILITINLKALSINETKHLLDRTSFSYTNDDLSIYKSLSKEESINLLINNAKNSTIIEYFPNIKKFSKRPSDFNTLKVKDKQKFRKTLNKKIYEMQINWYKMMLNTNTSFREKMTLFWHNHFVSEYKVVKNPYFMHEQNKLFRNNSLGKFDVMLRAVVKDKAMLIYLNNNSNKKDAPNENFSRELMELFTLGIGNYTEDDVKESARAFTGWRINRKTQTFKKVKKHHDFSKKQFLNQSGHFDGEDIVRIILDQEQSSVFIVTKLYKEFVGNTNNKLLISQIAKKFRNSSYDISIALKDILLSDDFWDENNKIIKSPIEFTISLIKNIGIIPNDKTFELLIKTNKKLDQILFDPPSVQGWLSDKNWINSSSLVNRVFFIRKLIKNNLKYLENKERRSLIKKYSDFEFQLK